MGNGIAHDADQLLTVPEVASILRCTENYVYKQVRLGKIPGGVKIDSMVRVRRSEFLDYLLRCEVKA
jgi:excisionase family DNA binding protein